MEEQKTETPSEGEQEEAPAPEEKGGEVKADAWFAVVMPLAALLGFWSVQLWAGFTLDGGAPFGPMFAGWLPGTVVFAVVGSLMVRFGGWKREPTLGLAYVLAVLSTLIGLAVGT